MRILKFQKIFSPNFKKSYFFFQVPYRWGQMTSTAMKGFVKTHDFKTYKGLAHSSGTAELQDIGQFLKSILPPNTP